MPDREKVISGLESLRDVCNAKSDMAIGEGRTVWAGYASVVHLALDLLREQKPVRPVQRLAGYPWYKCPCGYDEIYEGQHYCPDCGRRMLWDAAD